MTIENTLLRIAVALELIAARDIILNPGELTKDEPVEEKDPEGDEVSAETSAAETAAAKEDAAAKEAAAAKKQKAAAKRKAAAAKKQKDEEAAAKAKEEEEEGPTLTIKDVRAALTKLQSVTSAKVAKGILEAAGGTKILSKLPEGKYAEVIKASEEKAATTWADNEGEFLD